MPIEKQSFAVGMGLLAGAFSRTADEPVMKAYYTILTAQLSTAEFEEAVTRTLATETFWPSPAVLLGKIKAGDDNKAALAFEHVNRVTGGAGGFRFLSYAAYQDAFDAPTRIAIAAVGGLSEIANTPLERWPGLQRRFAAAYLASLRPALTAPTIDGRVRQLVGSVASTMGTLSGRDRAAGETESDDA